jgi:hypothetical protein
MRYYLIIMARIKKSPPVEALKVVTVKLTPAAEQMLQRISQDASDALGWTISNSAIIRALIRQVSQQGPPAANALFIEVEKEIQSGRVWGKKRMRTCTDISQE